MRQIVYARFFSVELFVCGEFGGPRKTGFVQLVSASHFAFERYRIGCTAPYVTLLLLPAVL
jgi:hypothetical protein